MVRTVLCIFQKFLSDFVCLFAFSSYVIYLLRYLLGLQFFVLFCFSSPWIKL